MSRCEVVILLSCVFFSDQAGSQRLFVTDAKLSTVCEARTADGIQGFLVSFLDSDAEC